MDNIYDVIIIGAGPAGLSAALYAKRGNLKTLIIEKSTPGGTLVSISHLYNYPGYNGIDGASLAFTMYEQVTNLNVDFVFEEVVEVKLENNLKIVKTNVNEYVCKNIIVATGTTYQNLKVAKGQIEGILNMIEDERYCIDISNQIIAVQSLLKKANMQILKRHISHCVSDAILENKGDEKIDEIMKIFEKISK